MERFRKLVVHIEMARRVLKEKKMAGKDLKKKWRENNFKNGGRLIRRKNGGKMTTTADP
jgi:hypothetical protein